MNDTSESSAQAWLLLITQLPTKPDYLRVKLRRRVQRIGAVGLRSSVYVLPAGDEAREDLAWLRREILSDGGEAMICESRLLEGMSDDQVEQLFRADRASRYRTITEEAGQDGADHGRLRRRLEEVVAMDYYDAPGRTEAEQAVAALAPRQVAAPASATGLPRGATWVTRRGVKVDRMASAWLIRRFIDPEAVFRFVIPGEPVGPGEVRFDMFDGEFTHEGDRCTFETLLHRAALDDPGVRVLAELVHDIDCKDGKFGRPEAAGLAATVDALVAAYPGDAERLAAALPLLDGLRLVLGRKGG
jgi:hypothetical protein